MNSILTAKILSSKRMLWGKDWYYEFRELPKKTSDEAIIRACPKNKLGDINRL